MAALDCSTKSKVRELPCKFDDGRPVPQPRRSAEFPMGPPSIKGHDKQRFLRDNDAAEFVLEEIQRLDAAGGGSVRENPANSYHWDTPTEVTTWASPAGDQDSQRITPPGQPLMADLMCGPNAPVAKTCLARR